MNTFPDHIVGLAKSIYIKGELCEDIIHDALLEINLPKMAKHFSCVLHVSVSKGCCELAKAIIDPKIYIKEKFDIDKFPWSEEFLHFIENDEQKQIRHST